MNYTYSEDYYKNKINLIIKSKVFISDLNSEGSEGSFIDIFSFMEKHVELKDLKLIFDLSSIQSIELDKAINEKFYEDHKENKEKVRGYNYAVVEGAGPIGLYTTFKLFIGKSLVLIV